MAGTDDLQKIMFAWLKSSPEGSWAAISILDQINQELQLGDVRDSSDFSATQAILMAACPAKLQIWSIIDSGVVSEACEEMGIPVEVVKGVPETRLNLVDFLIPDSEYLVNHFNVSAPGAIKTALGGLSITKTFPGKQLRLRELVKVPYMLLDLNAIRALDLFGTKPSSLYQLLNKTNNVLGASQLKRWISQPLKDVAQIQARQGIVESLLDNRDLCLQLISRLKQVPDLNALFLRFSRKLAGAKAAASLSDCVKLYEFVKVLQSIDRLLSNSQVPSLDVYITGVNQVNAGFANLIELVERGIDLERFSKDLEYFVNPEFSDETRVLREEIHEIEKSVEEFQNKAQKELRLSKPLKLVISQGHGFLFETNKADLDFAFRTLPSGHNYKVVSHKMHNTAFTHSVLMLYSSQKQEKQAALSKVQSGLADRVIDLVASYAQLLPKTSELIGELDTLLSFATVIVSAVSPYVKPRIIPDGDIVLYQNRHPGLEKLGHCQPNDVNMNRTKSRLQIITGPNMGGKTTYLRQVAISVILNQIGCLVPCSPGPNQLPIVDSIHARVGAWDQALSGVSTYMSEMLDMSSLIRSVTPNSLVIIDELGRGTSTSDGVGFSIATVEHLVFSAQCFALVATHFNELTTLRLPNVVYKRTAVVINNGKLQFLYALVDGAEDSSYGVEVAGLMGYSEEDVLSADTLRREMECELAWDDRSQRTFEEIMRCPEGENKSVVKCFF